MSKTTTQTTTQPISTKLVSALSGQTDAILLSQYSDTRNPALFSELARRYAHSVYGTCLRITSNVHDADELTQDCFFELAKQSKSIHSSLAGWLHRMATNRSLNRLRSRSRRKQHETASQDPKSLIANGQSAQEVTTWSDVAPILDEVIDSLPNDLRDPVLQHYLNGVSQSQLAEQLNLNQSTVSRRIKQGLEMLRSRLQKRGVTLSIASLLAFLSENSAEAATGLVSSVSKIGLLTAGGKAIGFTGVKLVAWAKLIGAMSAPVIVGLITNGWLTCLTTLLMMLYLAWYKPAWFVETLDGFSDGRAENFRDFNLFDRWAWKTIPPHAARIARSSYAMGGILILMAIVFYMMTDSRMRLGMVAEFAMIGAWRLAVAIRLTYRLYAANQSLKLNELDEEELPTVTQADIWQTAGCTLSMLLFIAWSVVMLKATEDSFYFAYAAGSCLGVIWGVAETVMKWTHYNCAPPKPEASLAANPQATAKTAKLLMAVESFGLVTVIIWILATFWRPSSASDSIPMIGVGAAMSVYFLSMLVKPISQLFAVAETQNLGRKFTLLASTYAVITCLVFAYWVMLCVRYLG